MTDPIVKAKLARLDQASRQAELARDEADQAGRQAELARERAECAMRRAASALEEQRRFAADAAHELRTTVAGLRAELEEARMHPDQTDLDGLLARTLNGVGRLQAAIGDLLLLARPYAGEPTRHEPVDLARLAAEAISTGAGSASSPSRGITVKAVRSELAKALAILLGEARRQNRGAVSVRVRRDGDVAELVVSGGDGATAAGGERMERFTRLDTFTWGEQGGLGLAIARGIAHAHHGTLWAYLRPCGARSFVLRLPMVPAGDGEGGEPGRRKRSAEPVHAA
ncbi:sensor histidine kinase [Sphaerisporangium dianthi]|uniref:histidine kinase n=1 Tax=Sphaerisporangium dianthi TaxID=1436120 RepID=A0ABV9CTC2_9ACTN